ncbi:MAG TPA: PilZ domain-containing protein [Candidatus Sulfotelmatobacter sp.]|nr:PilZ domain-containing protein [Candidatus Sulfotelmatobacter sp.]
MDQALDVRSFEGIRRWPRYEIDLPVRIIALNGVLTTPVDGRGHEISRAGMALQACVAVEPGDMMQLQFPTSDPSRVLAIVRNRSGNRMGLEFLSQLPPDDETKHRTKFLSALPPVRPTAAERSLANSCTPETLSARLQHKRDEQKQLEKEIEVLQLAIRLLAEDENEVALMPVRAGFDVRPWPLQS